MIRKIAAINSFAPYLLFTLAFLAYSTEIRHLYSGGPAISADYADPAGFLCVASCIWSLISYVRLRQRRLLVILILAICLFTVAETIRAGSV